eukprot:SAG31_NODE_2476_length_5639_cov_8.703069_2_plen_103_part_00
MDAAQFDRRAGARDRRGDDHGRPRPAGPAAGAASLHAADHDDLLYCVTLMHTDDRGRQLLKFTAVQLLHQLSTYSCLIVSTKIYVNVVGLGVDPAMQPAALY